MVVSNAVTNGNPVHGQSYVEAPGGCVRGRVEGVCKNVSEVCPAYVVCQDVCWLLTVCQ